MKPDSSACAQVPIPTELSRLLDGIKRDLKHGFEGVDWINLAYDCVQWRGPVNTAMRFSDRINSFKSLNN
jgi:hypothetical protein